jgi:protein-L-isoaspartate(D-aspartate) O-methyltransferase
MRDAIERMLHTLRMRGVTDEAVLRAMANVPREAFVPEEHEAQAYGDHPLPIGQGQTISQPYIVALMTQELDLQPGEKVLEIGTGSGYQTAVLAEMDAEVHTVEVLPELQEEAREHLEELGYEGIHYRVGNGSDGWPEHAPYDAVIVTAAPPAIPDALVEQLDEGGRLIIPVGPRGFYQTLWKIVKRDGKIEKSNLGGVAFVPLVDSE